MKKKNFKHNGLHLNKNVISSLKSDELQGGRTRSCLADIDTNCASANCGTLGCPTNGCPPTGNCPTNGCPPSISCQPVGIC
ncbi:MAG: hypothetical protein AB8B65_06460 [Kordia sp.]|uniref:hypothetical protein n=1 Tax=Kordia sp. TaxID=1965332 RepID=UPI00385891B8